MDLVVCDLLDSAENGFQWENEDTPFEEKSLLIDSLPEGFKYRVKKQKILEQSEIKEELKFKVEFEVNICDKEEALKFVQLIVAKNDMNSVWTSKLYSNLDVQTGF